VNHASGHISDQGAAIKSIFIALALLVAGAVQANPLVDKLIDSIEASPAGCKAVPSSHTQRQVMEADVARFRQRVPGAAKVGFQVLDCEADGFVYQGQTIVLSTRLARLNPQQRFFIIAHELGHLSLGHHGAMRSFVASIVDQQGDEAKARAQLVSSLSAISHRHELNADAFAVRTMLAAGQDPEQAARIFDSIADDRDNNTHPSARRRAAAIRSLGALSARASAEGA
jgi:Zn-dependent protease with chaperone function